MVDIAVAVTQARPQTSRSQEAELADLCDREVGEALREKGIKVDLAEQIFRESLAKDITQIKGSFMEQATKPYHD